MEAKIDKADLVVVLSLLLLFSMCGAGDNYPDYSRGNPYERTSAYSDSSD